MLTGGAYATFDLSAPERLVALLCGRAAYAAGGRARARIRGPRAARAAAADLLLGATARRAATEMIYLRSPAVAPVLWLVLRRAEMRSLAQANPASLARAGHPARRRQCCARLGGCCCYLRGRIDMAIGLGGLGAWLLGMSNGSFSRLFKSSAAAKDRARFPASGRP